MSTHEQRAATLDARQLSLATSQGTVFGPVDWHVPAGSHGAVLGQQGSGRSAFLLALGGRMKGTTGELTVGGVDGIRHPRALRQRTAIARITDLAELEPSLTVGEARDEGAILQGVGTRKGRRTFSELQELVGLHFDTERLVGDLAAVHRTQLAVLLGCLRESDFVLVDDVDDSLTLDQLEEVYHAFDLLAEHGHHFIVSALETSPAPHGASTVVLAPSVENERLALRFGHLRPRRLRPVEQSERVHPEHAAVDDPTDRDEDDHPTGTHGIDLFRAEDEEN